jgi:RNA-binding protein PNO1
MEGGVIARMLEHGDGEAYMLKTGELEARAESEKAAAEHEEDGVEDGDEDPSKPSFSALTAAELQGGKVLFRRVPVPAHRFTPLKEKWMDLYQPIVKHMKLQIRMNLKTRSVELRTSEHTEEVSALQKSHDFIRAFLMGFEVQVCACARARVPHARAIGYLLFDRSVCVSGLRVAYM